MTFTLSGFSCPKGHLIRTQHETTEPPAGKSRRGRCGTNGKILAPNQFRHRNIPMRQLLLDLLPESPPTLDNFVPGGNAETLAALTGWLAGARAETSFCLWGEAGSGRSHLLQACGFTYVDAACDPALATASAAEQLAVDHVDALDETGRSRCSTISTT